MNTNTKNNIRPILWSYWRYDYRKPVCSAIWQIVPIAQVAEENEKYASADIGVKLIFSTEKLSEVKTGESEGYGSFLLKEDPNWTRIYKKDIPLHILAMLNG